MSTLYPNHIDDSFSLPTATTDLGTSSDLIAANLSALTAADSTLPSGTRAFVLTLEQSFLLDRNSTATPDGITVIAYTSGGNWLRLSDLSPKWIEQPTWFINADLGNDENDGSSSITALKHYAEWQRRAGTFTVLNPIGGQLTLHVLTDLPQSDPITFRNFLANLADAFIIGSETVLGTHTITSVTARNRSTNIPYKVNVAGLDWTPFLGLPIKASNGSRAIICRDLGGGTAHISTWVSGSGMGEDVVPANPPSPGDIITIVDYPHAYLGTLAVGVESKEINFAVSGSDTGLTIIKIHHPQSSGDVHTFPSFPQNIGNAGTLSAMTDCILDEGSKSESGETVMASNISFRRNLHLLGGQFNLVAGAFLPYILGDDYPGGIRQEEGNTLTTGGDPTFIGDFVFDGINVTGSTAADIQVMGNTFLGPMSFWNTFHSVFPLIGGRVNFEPNDPLFGDLGIDPLWGNGNIAGIVLFTGSTFCINQIGVGGVPPEIPSIVFDDAGVNGMMFFAAGDGGGNSSKAFTFDPATSAYTPPGGTFATWTLFDTLIGAGGFRYLDDAVEKCATAESPNLKTGMTIAKLLFP